MAKNSHATTELAAFAQAAAALSEVGQQKARDVTVAFSAAMDDLRAKRS